MDDHSPLLLPHFPSVQPPPLTKPPLDHFINMYPSQADTANIYESSPEELVDRALKTLQDAGIQLIEWQSLLHRRMNVPVVIRVSFGPLSSSNSFLLHCPYRTSITLSRMNNWTRRASSLLITSDSHDPVRRPFSSELAEISTRKRACSALHSPPPSHSHNISFSTQHPSRHIPLSISRLRRPPPPLSSRCARQCSSHRDQRYMRQS